MSDNINNIKNKEYILLDLDGTITSSAKGIIKSVLYALDKMNEDYDKNMDFSVFVGPPLRDSFKNFLGFNNEKTSVAVDYFREYYKKTGIFENDLYAGIKDLLEQLKASGKKLALATSKQTDQAHIVLNYFKIEEYFDFIAGAHEGIKRDNKGEVIEYALKNLNALDKKDKCLHIGDTTYDIIGALDNNIDVIAVLYGYGKDDELVKAHPTFIAKTVEDLKNILL